MQGRSRERRRALQAAACHRGLTAGPCGRWSCAPCRPAPRRGAGPATGASAPARRTACGCAPRSCCESCGSARAHEHHQQQAWLGRGPDATGVAVCRTTQFIRARRCACWCCLRRRARLHGQPHLRARFDDGGRRGGGDLRSLSRFLLPPGGERSWLRRPLRSASLDRLPMGEPRFSERPDDESEDASDELSLQRMQHHHLGDQGARQSGE